MADLKALSNEITDDPLGRGYSAMTDQQIADDLNTAYRTRALSSLSGDEIFQQTDPTEFTNLTTDKQTQWLSFCGRASVDPFATANVEFVKWIFGASSTTVANLSESRAESVTRAEELALLGRSDEIGPAHVAEARA